MYWLVAQTKRKVPSVKIHVLNFFCFQQLISVCQKTQIINLLVLPNETIIPIFLQYLSMNIKWSKPTNCKKIHNWCRYYFLGARMAHNGLAMVRAELTFKRCFVSFF